MPSNYNTLLSSEKELSDLFFDNLEHLLKMHKFLWASITEKKNYEKVKEKIAFYTEESIKKSKDILDDCVWIISKDQPRANHLRFIISMIHSVKDLEALSKYPNKILAIYSDEIKITKSLEKLVKNYLEIFQEVIKMLKQKQAEANYKKSLELKDNFLKIYDDFIQKDLNLKADKINSKNYLDTYKIVKSLDKTIDHLFNLFDNFKFIKSGPKKTIKINL
ncbi:MAG: PhoU domain-containing protein [Mycoplasmoidaceae bacterium]